MPPMPSFLTRPCWDTQFFFVIKYLMLTLTMCLLAAETFALELDVRKTSDTLNSVAMGGGDKRL